MQSETDLYRQDLWPYVDDAEQRPSELSDMVRSIIKSLCKYDLQGKNPKMLGEMWYFPFMSTITNEEIALGP